MIPPGVLPYPPPASHDEHAAMRAALADPASVPLPVIPRAVARMEEDDAFDDARDAAHARGIGAPNLAAVLHHRAKAAGGLTLQPLTLAAWVLLDAIANPTFQGRSNEAGPLDLLHLALCMARPEIAEEVIDFTEDGKILVKRGELNRAALAMGRTLTDADLRAVMAHTQRQMAAVPEGTGPLAAAGTAAGTPDPAPVG